MVLHRGLGSAGDRGGQGKGTARDQVIMQGFYRGSLHTPELDFSLLSGEHPTAFRIRIVPRGCLSLSSAPSYPVVVLSPTSLPPLSPLLSSSHEAEEEHGSTSPLAQTPQAVSPLSPSVCPGCPRLTSLVRFPPKPLASLSLSLEMPV